MSSKYRTTLNVKRLTEFRHDLHMHPELKFMEHRTSDKIAAFLTELDIPYKRGLASTGIVGSIYGKNRSANDPGPALGIRADIDALPLEEANKFTHASKHKGCMHGCGHDGHTAMLLGAAELLSANRDFDGTIHLIFQPGEEGGAGARVMMNEGLFKLFPCQAVFALHNWPHLPQGQMGTKIGPIMASGVTFEITVFGKGGHAALPQSTIDPVPVACFIVSHLQTLISRRMNPLDAAVLTIGKIEAGSSPNIIPSEAKIMGTCRTLTNEAQSLILDNMQRIAISIAEAHGAHAEVIIKQGGYPNTNNHPKEARFMAKMMREIVGENNAHDNVLPAMTAEDFGFMLQEVPGAYGWIGNGNDALSQGDLHSTSYDFNDKNLELGALFWEKQEALHRLLELGFDFDTPRVPIVVTVQVEQHQLSDILSTLLREFSQLSGVSDVILLGSHEILILNALSEAQETLLRGIEFVLSSQISHYHIGIGVQADSAPDIREAIRFARSVIEVGSKVQPQRQIYYFREMAMLCLFRVLEDSYMVNFFINNVRQLLEHDSGEVLLDTLSSFIANNAEPGKTSLLLGIHRNTLTYRLQQIKKHIQLDPMVFTDLTQLAVSVHCYRRLNPRQSEWIDSLS